MARAASGQPQATGGETVLRTRRPLARWKAAAGEAAGSGGGAAGKPGAKGMAAGRDGEGPISGWGSARGGEGGRGGSEGTMVGGPGKKGKGGGGAKEGEEKGAGEGGNRRAVWVGAERRGAGGGWAGRETQEKKRAGNRGAGGHRTPGGRRGGEGWEAGGNHDIKGTNRAIRAGGGGGAAGEAARAGPGADRAVAGGWRLRGIWVPPRGQKGQIGGGQGGVESMRAQGARHLATGQCGRAGAERKLVVPRDLERREASGQKGAGEPTKAVSALAGFEAGTRPGNQRAHRLQAAAGAHTAPGGHDMGGGGQGEGAGWYEGRGLGGSHRCNVVVVRFGVGAQRRRNRAIGNHRRARLPRGGGGELGQGGKIDSAHRYRVPVAVHTHSLTAGRQGKESAAWRDAEGQWEGYTRWGGVDPGKRARGGGARGRGWRRAVVDGHGWHRSLPSRWGEKCREGWGIGAAKGGKEGGRGMAGGRVINSGICGRD
ncbi:unnamed protein product [Prunus armeniaca]|uniref:Uncharacterized protein n=1 Tax=Prunus armeniaca TaxID=36596 RepID=A0A6J5VVU7_PRUAR|nr:unnamed protein product [Prunus armeniaca]